MSKRAAERRRRLTRRALPLGGAALVALAAGAVIGSLSESAGERVVRSFAGAWERGDYRAMYALLTTHAQSRYDRAVFGRAYGAAAATATATRIRPAEPADERDGRVRLPVEVDTLVFGTLRGDIHVPVADGKIGWRPELAFPGLAEGARLRRRTASPRRAPILSRSGQALAKGDGAARVSPLGVAAASVVGAVAPAESRPARAAVYARGFPRTMPVGQSGLERAYERELAGRPGGELLAGHRVLARTRPRPAPALRTTIDTRLQEAALTGLAGRLGGVAAVDARTGEVRALAGLALSGPQPPGSTFKLVTTTAALEARAVKLSSTFPVRTHAVIDGVPLDNANGESCGGTFENSFAQSCNSVFAPLGLKVGAKRLVDVAERYGFNAPPGIAGEVPSTIPPAREIRSPLEVGSTAIGQDRVLATPLELASIAQTVAADGVRTRPTLRRGARRRTERVTSRRVARTLRRLMVDVVAYGTGSAAALPGVTVAGKTGTAELEDTRGPRARNLGVRSDPESTDAWFTCFAPADAPRIAVAVLLVRAGAGGQTAAPAARVVLESALG